MEVLWLEVLFLKCLNLLFMSCIKCFYQPDGAFQLKTAWTDPCRQNLWNEPQKLVNQRRRPRHNASRSTDSSTLQSSVLGSTMSKVIHDPKSTLSNQGSKSPPSPGLIKSQAKKKKIISRIKLYCQKKVISPEWSHNNNNKIISPA